MPKDEEDRLFDALRGKESSEPHSNFDAVTAAIDARLIESLSDPEIGGLDHVVEVMSDPAYEIGEKSEYLLGLFRNSYLRGRDDQRRIDLGDPDENLRAIANYDPKLSPPPQTDTLPPEPIE